MLWGWLVVGREAQTLTIHFEPGGGLGGARCPRLHHAHVVVLVAHLGLRQNQAPPGVQLVRGAAAPGVEHFVPELGATQLGGGQEVADLGAVDLRSGERLSERLPGRRPSSVSPFSAAPWVSLSQVLALSLVPLPSLQLSHPAACLRSPFPLSGSLFCPLTVLPPLSPFPALGLLFLLLFIPIPGLLPSGCLPLNVLFQEPGDCFHSSLSCARTSGYPGEGLPLAGPPFPHL